MDPQKFTTIAHGDHRYYSPLSAAKAALLNMMESLRIDLKPHGIGHAHLSRLCSHSFVNKEKKETVPTRG